jgi:hypothetical protein
MSAEKWALVALWHKYPVDLDNTTHQELKTTIPIAQGFFAPNPLEMSRVFGGDPLVVVHPTLVSFEH